MSRELFSGISHGVNWGADGPHPVLYVSGWGGARLPYAVAGLVSVPEEFRPVLPLVDAQDMLVLADYCEEYALGAGDGYDLAHHLRSAAEMLTMPRSALLAGQDCWWQVNNCVRVVRIQTVGPKHITLAGDFKAAWWALRPATEPKPEPVKQWGPRLEALLAAELTGGKHDVKRMTRVVNFRQLAGRQKSRLVDFPSSFHDRKVGRLVWIGNGLPKLGLRRSKWASPFVIGRDGDREECRERYREYLEGTPELMRQLGFLRGATLVCTCAPEPCHGDVLVDLLRTGSIPPATAPPQLTLF